LDKTSFLLNGSPILRTLSGQAGSSLELAADHNLVLIQVKIRRYDFSVFFNEPPKIESP
jgi:hypothetical protein